MIAVLPQTEGAPLLLPAYVVSDSDFQAKVPLLPAGGELPAAGQFHLLAPVFVVSEEQPRADQPAQQRSLSNRRVHVKSYQSGSSRTSSPASRQSRARSLSLESSRRAARRPQARASCLSNVLSDHTETHSVVPTADDPDSSTTHSVFAEVSSTFEPRLTRFSDGTYLLEVPEFITSIQTSVTPALPVLPGMKPFKPERQIPVTLPGMGNVMFDPKMRIPPNAAATSSTVMYGVLFHYPDEVGLDVRIKTHTLTSTMTFPSQGAHGDTQVGEHELHWELKTEASFAEKGGPSDGLRGLEVDLKFIFTAAMKTTCRAGW